MLRAAGCVVRACGGLALALLLLGAAGCASETPAGPRLIGEGRRILFVGNSLTYVNDLPGIVQALADSAGGDRLAVQTVAGPDLALVDHWGAASDVNGVLFPVASAWLAAWERDATLQLYAADGLHRRRPAHISPRS